MSYLGELLHVGGLDVDDVEALVGDLHVPEVDPEVVGGEIRLTVRVDGDAVDVVGVRVGEDAPRGGLHHELHRLQDGDLEITRPFFINFVVINLPSLKNWCKLSNDLSVFSPGMKKLCATAN